MPEGAFGREIRGWRPHGPAHLPGTVLGVFGDTDQTGNPAGDDLCQLPGQAMIDLEAIVAPPMCCPARRSWN